MSRLAGQKELSNIYDLYTQAYLQNEKYTGLTWGSVDGFSITRAVDGAGVYFSPETTLFEQEARPEIPAAPDRPFVAAQRAQHLSDGDLGINIAMRIKDCANYFMHQGVELQDVPDTLRVCMAVNHDNGHWTGVVVTVNSFRNFLRTDYLDAISGEEKQTDAEMANQFLARLKNIKVEHYDSLNSRAYHERIRISAGPVLESGVRPVQCGRQKSFTCGDHTTFNLFVAGIFNVVPEVNTASADHPTSEELRAFTDSLPKETLANLLTAEELNDLAARIEVPVGMLGKWMPAEVERELEGRMSEDAIEDLSTLLAIREVERHAASRGSSPDPKRVAMAGAIIEKSLKGNEHFIIKGVELSTGQTDSLNQFENKAVDVLMELRKCAGTKTPALVHEIRNCVLEGRPVDTATVEGLLEGDHSPDLELHEKIKTSLLQLALLFSGEDELNAGLDQDDKRIYGQAAQVAGIVLCSEMEHHDLRDAKTLTSLLEQKKTFQDYSRENTGRLARSVLSGVLFVAAVALFSVAVVFPPFAVVFGCLGGAALMAASFFAGLPGWIERKFFKSRMPETEPNYSPAESAGRPSSIRKIIDRLNVSSPVPAGKGRFADKVLSVVPIDQDVLEQSAEIDASVESPSFSLSPRRGVDAPHGP